MLAFLLTAAGKVDALLVERSFEGDPQQAKVTLSIEATEADLPYTLEERLPRGLSAFDISAGGSFDERNGEVKWGPVTSAGQLTLSYFIGGGAGDFLVAGEAIGGTGSTSILPDSFSLSGADFWRSNGVIRADGWLYNEWLGRIWWPLEVEDWLFHETHGYLHYLPNRNHDGLFFYDPRLDWIYTGSVFYSWMFAYNGLGWLYYWPGTREPRWFYVASEGQWVYEWQLKD